MANVQTEDQQIVTMTIKVLSASNIKGSKGEHVNSFVRVQFADYDYRDTTVAIDSASPEYNLTFDQPFTLIETVANKSITVTLIESLPKEKTNVLGTGEVSLYKRFLDYYKRETPDAPVPECTLLTKEVVSINYANPKMLQPQDKPEVVLEISLSKALIEPSVMAKGVFATLELKDMYPLPEDWTLKEGNEKDLNSSIDLEHKEQDRTLVLNTGGLTTATEKILDPIETTPRPIRDDESEKPGSETEHQTEEVKKIAWTGSSLIWLSPTVLGKLNVLAQKKKHLELEVWRQVSPKFNVQDTAVHKHKGKISIDIASLMYPNVLGFKGRYPITKSVSDFIPKRVVDPNLSHKKKSEQAELEFKKQIRGIAERLVGEYKETLRLEAQQVDKSLDPNDPKLAEKRKKLFMFHLNKTGVYYNFKEQLKSAVVQIRFQKKSPFTENSELHGFMSQVYIYLVDEMHKTLHEFFKQVDQEKNLQVLAQAGGQEALLQFAQIAEQDGNISIAAKYHQERVAKLDYGQFCMRQQMPAKAEECFREILSRNPKHILTLLTFGSITALKQHYEEARVYLHKAVDADPNNVLSNTVLALFYSSISEELEASKYLQQVQQICESLNKPKNQHFVQVAEFAVNAHLPELADQALAQELVLNGPSVKPYILLAQLDVQRRLYTSAANRLKEALKLDQTSADVWACLGHLNFIQGRFNYARTAYENVLASDCDNDLIFNRLGAIYLREAYRQSDHFSLTMNSIKNLDKSAALIAKDMYLKACAIKATSQSWLGEANVINHRDSDVWACLSLLSLVLDRPVEANQCINQAFKLDISCNRSIATGIRD
ncbi:hypothetical protein EDD86DRAFT_246421 [Gorgonomyces haynaldii]|nr:hypothetical protein EDD86DRAFT_246421 [Gorgonomyces haynaldii]